MLVLEAQIFKTSSSMVVLWVQMNSHLPYGINFTWSQRLVDRLVMGGVREFVISPGGRSMALVVAIREHPACNLTVHPDERGAGYFAVGKAKREGIPAVLVSTSGTAVANYYPAVLEACHSRTPLIVLTADMPHHLSERGENQSISQTAIFGDNLCWSEDYEIAKSSLEDSGPEAFAESLVSYSVSGPVHLNCRFDKPLLGASAHEADPAKPNNRTPYSSPGSYHSQVRPSSVNGSPEKMAAVAKSVAGASKGLISVGSLSAFESTSAILEFAENSRWPVVADCISSIRWSGQSEAILKRSDLALQQKEIRELFEPDFILHFGGQPLQNSHNEFISATAAPLVVVAGGTSEIDPWTETRKEFS